MSILCPTCNASLNATASGSMSFCLACCTTNRAKQPKSKIAWSAIFSLVCGIISLSFLVGIFLDNQTIFANSLFCLFFGSIAITNGIRAIDNIRLPHKRRGGTAIARIGVVLGIVTFFVPIGLFSWLTTVGMEHVLSKNRVSIRSKGWSGQSRSRTVLRKLSQASVAFDKCREANGYQPLLDTEQITWRVYHPVKLDPMKIDADFHSTFMNADFDDSNWQSFTDTGDGVGYGDDRYGFQLSRPEELADRKTAYLRTVFETDVPLKRIVMQLRMDDAVILYIDGKRFLRANMPAKSKEGYSVMAARAISDGDEETTVAEESVRALPAGTHVLAISLHNVVNSSDLGVQRVMIYGLPADAPDPKVKWWEVAEDGEKESAADSSEQE